MEFATNLENLDLSLRLFSLICLRNITGFLTLLVYECWLTKYAPSCITESQSSPGLSDLERSLLWEGKPRLDYLAPCAIAS